MTKSVPFFQSFLSKPENIGCDSCAYVIPVYEVKSSVARDSMPRNKVMVVRDSMPRKKVW